MSNVHVLYPAAEAPVAPARVDANDQVAVTHHGMTKVYDCPGDLHAAVLVACGPELEAAEKARARRRLRLYTNAVRRRRRTQVRLLGQIVTVAAACGVVAALGAGVLGLVPAAERIGSPAGATAEAQVQ